MPHMKAPPKAGPGYTMAWAGKEARSGPGSSPPGAQNRRDVPVRFSTTPAGLYRRDVSLPRPSALPTLSDRIDFALQQRGYPRQILPSEETSRRWWPAGVVLKRTGNVSTAPRL